MAGTSTRRARNSARPPSGLDKVAAKHTIHKNTAARKRSRLAKRLNAMIATGGAPKPHGKGTKAAKTQS